MSVFNQLIIFFSVIIWGSFIGIIFDIYRSLRQFWRPGKWGTSLGDLVFWLIITLMTYFVLLLVSWGEVRFYVFLGMGIGLVIYLKYFSKTMRKYSFMLIKVLGEWGEHLKKGIFRCM